MPHQEPAPDVDPVIRSLDQFREDFTRKIDAFERRLTIKFGLMFYAGCALTIALWRLWR